MLVVLDTNILCEAVKNSSIPHLLVMTALPSRAHSLVLDHDRALLGQYDSNLSTFSLYRKWFTELTVRNMIHFTHGALPSSAGTHLTSLGFNDSVDRTVVALALNSHSYLVTEDSDFGKGPSAKAADHQDVLTYLVNDLGLVVHDAAEASSHLNI
jgi:hypothetical protein